MKLQWNITRDVLLFFGGLAGAAHETLASGAERPYLLVLFGAMMGIPAFLTSDREGKKAEKREDQDG